MTLVVTPATEEKKEEKPDQFLFFYCDMNGDLRVAKTEDPSLASHYVDDPEFIVVKLTPEGPKQVLEAGLAEIEAAEAPEEDLPDDDEEDDD